MPTKRSHSSQFQFRGDGNRHPSPRRSVQKLFPTRSSAGYSEVSGVTYESQETIFPQSSLRSSVRINEIRARANEKINEPTPAIGSQNSNDQKERRSALTRRSSIQSRTKRPQVQRSFKPRTSVSSDTQSSRMSGSSAQGQRPSVVSAKSRPSHAAQGRAQLNTQDQKAGSSRARKRIVPNRQESLATVSIAEQNMSSHIWDQGRQSSKRSDSAYRSAASGRNKNSKRVSSSDYSGRKRGVTGQGAGVQPLHSVKKHRSFPFKPLVAVFVVVVIALGAYGVDSLLNGNKIYQGVSIGDINVSGLTREEAVNQVSGYYSPRVSENVPTFFSTSEAQANPQTADDAGNIEEQISYEESLETRTQWTLPASKLDATFDVEGIVDQAFQVGRDTGGIIARIQAAVSGWHFAPECTFNETTLSETLSEMTASIGNERVNFNIEMNDEGIASVTSGHDGNEVVRDWLTSRLNDTYFGANQNSSYVLEAQYMPLQITEELAQACADKVNASLASGANFSFEGQTWNASRTDLSPWITTSIEQVGDSWELKPSFDEATAKKALLSSLHSNIQLSDLQVTFSKDDQGAITVSSNATGTVPLVSDAVASMNETFFVNESRTEAPTIELSSTDLPSTVSFDDAKDFGLISEISSFTTQYSSGAEARTVNIHTAADLLSNSIIKANGGTWSFNDTAGEATEDKGYQNAGAIVGGEYSDAIGGGICQVATTVFNAIYDAGYPITERHNHTLHIESYPEGRDAAIAYPYMDLVWQNDTSSDVILVMSYTNSSVTCTLWGVDPGYEVTTDYGDWQKGEPYSVKYKTDDTVAEGTEYVETTGVNGSSISITRVVKDSDGNVLHEDVFESNYAPKDEVIVKGTA